MHILDLVLFYPKTYFIVVKQENKVDHVKLGIFSTPFTYKVYLKPSYGYLVMK